MTELLLAGFSSSVTCLFTHPLEVVKIRMQLQGELKSKGCYTRHYKNLFHGIYVIARHDGLLALQKGLVPGIYFQFCFNGLRLGIFQLSDNFGLTRDINGNVSALRSVFFGATIGALSSFISSPLYLMKTQLQAQSSSKISVGHQHSLNGMTDGVRNTFKSHGIRGLWHASSSSIARMGVGSAAQLATFTKSKEFINDLQLSECDSWLNVFAAACLSGLVVTVFMNPFDVIATRMYNQPVDANGKGKLYSGVLNTMTKIVNKEGFFGLYKGWFTLLARVAPHTVLNMFFWTLSRKTYHKYYSKPS